jgi:hypothetical protein
MSQTQDQSLPRYRGGLNISLKLPPDVFGATLAFYRDTLRLPVLEQFSPGHVFQFGPNNLWLDQIEGLSKPELWLEIITTNTAAAKEHLAAQGIVRCDEVEALPAGFDGFWVRSPSSVVHLVRGEKEFTGTA